MDPQGQYRRLMSRRYFLGSGSGGIGAAALATMAGSGLEALPSAEHGSRPYPTLSGLPHFAPKARRIIWLFQSGGPSQMELFDYKPLLQKRGDRSYLIRSARGND